MSAHSTSISSVATSAPCATGSGSTCTGTGAMFEPQDLLKRVTGHTIDPAPYLAYLERKLRDLFGAAVL